MIEPLPAAARSRWSFWTLVALLVVIAFAGGSNRQDVPGLLALRPLSVVALAVGLWHATRDALVPVRLPLLLLLALLGVALIQLVPLPPPLWTRLPGRELIVAAGDVAGIGQPWRPISLVPARTAAFIFGLVVPIAVLVLAASCQPRERRRLVFAAVAFGFVSLALGVIQVASESGARLYLYEWSTAGAPVGFFSNRNHQAMLLACLVPLLGALAAAPARRQRWRRPVLAGLGAVLLVALLLIGSRGGLALGLMALCSVPLVIGVRSTNIRSLAFGGVALALLTGVYVQSGRAEAIDRIFATSPEAERRLQVFEPIFDHVVAYLPVGAGFGTFVEVYEQFEPDALLDPTYLNRAHDDALEFALEGGLASAAIAAAAIALWLGRTVRLLGPEAQATALQRAGLVILIVLAFGSVGDYPLRVPIIQALAMLAVAWSVCPMVTAEARDLGLPGRQIR